MAKERLTDLNMSLKDVVLAMGEGNPGALNVLIRLIQEAESIDPDGAMGGFGTILLLDSLNIYGGDIWNLWKCVCGEDMVKMIAVLRAYQLGGLAGMDQDRILQAIRNRSMVDTDVILAAVRERLPNFSPLPDA